MTRKRIAQLDVESFMRRHWQRKPLLVRGAFPAFADPLAPSEVLRLAGDPDASARLVRRSGKKWTLEHGPFSPARFKQLPSRDWTVLVQDTNHFSPRADRLLASFDFIPHARIDDVMVSYAAPGGGVGPHVDSYDVFLLQGYGRRRWQVSMQRDHAFVPGLPLKILARFEPTQEWVLETGDMLYLPPGVAHCGVAESECLTWSIGFRAPTDRELVGAFLEDLGEQLELPGQYTDPGTGAARHPGALPGGLVDHAERALARITWTRAQVRDFAGRFVTEPKAQVFFTPPARPLGREAFAAAAARRGVRLDPRSRLAFSGTMFYLNGEAVAIPAAARPTVRRLADARALAPPRSAPAALWGAIHPWYLQGFLSLDEEAS